MADDAGTSSPQPTKIQQEASPTATQPDVPYPRHGDTSSKEALQQDEFASDGSSSTTITPDSTLPQNSITSQSGTSIPQHVDAGSENFPQQSTTSETSTSETRNPNSTSKKATAPVPPKLSPSQGGIAPSDGTSENIEDVRTENASGAASPHSPIDLPSDGAQTRNDKGRKDITLSMTLDHTKAAELADLLSSGMLLLKDGKKPGSQATGTGQIASPRLDIGELSQEEFKSSSPLLCNNPKRSGHFIADLPRRPLYVIEVLLKESIAPELHPRRNRLINHPQRTTVPDGPLQRVPDRIRIRSAFLLDLLHRIMNVRLDHGGGEPSVNERTSLVFLYPFKFFINYAENIEAEAKRLRTKFGDGGRFGQQHTSTSLNDTATVDSPAQMPGDSSTDPDAPVGDDYESEKALNHLELLSKLLRTYLKPVLELRKGYRTATHTTVSFQDLWLLFEVGGLVFQREPLPDHPPSICRVTCYNGGRQILNNCEFKHPEVHRDVQGPNSKGKENRFYIRHYHLDFDGEYYGPVENTLTIPPWEGVRSIYDLKLFPLNFCRNTTDHKFGSLDEFRNHVIGRGKSFMKLNAIDHKHYNGQVIGTHHEFYNSQVVIDFKLQGRDTESKPGLFGWMESVLTSESDLATGLNIWPGDPREVQEGTLRANSTMECVFPGCDDNDFIHDDMLLDDIIAHQETGEYGITSAKFSRSDVNKLSDLDYTLFPTFVRGYVLNNRIWAKLDLDFITNIPSTGCKFDALRIPQGHKDALRALVDMCNNGSSSHLALDIVPGKGRGIIILLHGRPGVGKTATAEAMAADMGRPLYPITYADLGDGPSAIETNLKRIFRYGHRWNCVLLLDEADVFLMPRDREDTKRNSVVSIFLRNFEWYPGIIFLTTNRLDQFDEGVLDRVHLKLRYPKLSESFTEEIFNDHFERINQLPSGEHELSRSRCRVKSHDIEQIREWRKDQYRHANSSKASNAGWWNGREIRVAFQLATSFAIQDMKKDRKDTASIKLRHFEKVLSLKTEFESDLANAVDDQPDAADQVHTSHQSDAESKTSANLGNASQG